MLLSNQNWLPFVSVAYLKIWFLSRPNLTIYKAYATSQKCALMHDAMAYVWDIQNINTGVIGKYPVESW